MRPDTNACGSLVISYTSPGEVLWYCDKTPQCEYSKAIINDPGAVTLI